MSAYQLARVKARRGDLSGALNCLEHSAQGARDLTISHKVQSALEELVWKSQAVPLVASWDLETFGSPPPWDRSKALILTGNSGLGKTCLARALMPTALFCNQIEDIRNFTTLHNGIIFDDMNFLGDPLTGKGAWSREWQIHLVDFDYPRSLRLRYKNFTIPAGTSKIFTTNLLAREILTVHDEAIRRRTTAWLVFGKIGDLKYTVLY